MYVFVKFLYLSFEDGYPGSQGKQYGICGGRSGSGVLLISSLSSLYNTVARSHQCPCGIRQFVPASSSLHPRFSFKASTLIERKSIEHF